MRKLSAVLLLLVCAAFAADPSSSAPITPVQPAAPAKEPANPALHGPNEFSVWGGVSASEPNVIALSSDVRLSLLGLRYGHRFYNGRHVALTYTANFLPVMLVSQPRVYESTLLGGRELVYGAGFMPLGARFDFRPRHRWQPFVDLGVGAALFSRPVPYTDAAKFNFLAELGGGVEYFQRNGHALIFGYKLHHVSNAARVRENPGIDSNMLYTGFSFFK
jgi:hypothetical protein